MAFVFLLVYVVMLLIRPHEWGIESEESSLLRIALIACMCVFLVFNKHKNLLAPQLTLMLVLTVGVMFSLASIGWLGGALEYGVDFMSTALIPFMLVSGILDNRRKQDIVFLIIVLAALIMVLNGYVQITSSTGLGIAGNPMLDNEDAGGQRITYLGFFNDPNDLGMYFVMSLPVLVYLKSRSVVFFKGFFWLAIIAVCYGIYLTNSRGTLLAALSLIGVWFLRKYGWTKSIYLGIATSPLLLVALSKFRTISLEDSSSQGRLDAWYEGFQMFLSNPLFGVGNRLFMDHHNQTAHNSLVLVLAELGLFGCLAWTSILVITIYLLLRISRLDFVPKDLQASDPVLISAQRESKIALTLLYSFVAFLVSAFFLSRAYFPVLYLFIGMGAASWGRIHLLFPQAGMLFEPKEIAILTLQFTFAALLVIYILMKIGL